MIGFFVIHVLFFVLVTQETCATTDYTGEWTLWVGPTPASPLRFMYADGLFIVCGNQSEIFTSNDGISWTLRTPIVYGQNLLSMAYGNGLFLITINSLSNIMKSTDGISWEIVPRTSFLGEVLAFGCNMFVMCGGGGYGIYTSPNGIDWFLVDTSGVGASVVDLIFANDRFVGVGVSVIATSVDGMTWISQTQLEMPLRSIVYGNDLFVAVGDSGSLMYSSDGIIWTSGYLFTKSAGSSLAGVAYGDGRFVAADNVGWMYGSEDGFTWVNLTANPANDGWSWGSSPPSSFLGYGPGRFIFLAPGGRIFSAAGICGVCNISSVSSCNGLSGCFWNGVSCESTSYTCDWEHCFACSNTSCNPTTGCYWNTGHCQSTSSSSCNKSSCSACSDIECGVKGCVYELGTCHQPPLTCREGNCTACSADDCYILSYCYLIDNTCVNFNDYPSCDRFSNPKYCSPCKSWSECTRYIESYSCRFTEHICSCSSLHSHVSSYPSENGFYVLLNSSNTTQGLYYTRLTVGQQYSNLSPYSVTTVGGVSAVLRVVTEDCSTVSVEWTLVAGETDATVNVCLYGNTQIQGQSNINWNSLDDKHGVYSPSHSFYIQSEEPFSGTFGGSRTAIVEACTSSSATTEARVTSGISVNWNNVFIGMNETRVFRLSFATGRAVYGSCLGGNCSACESDECYSHSSRCYVNTSSDDCETADNHRTCGTVETGFECSSCLSQWECQIVMNNLVYTCFWDRLNHQCGSDPVTCSEGNCSACAYDNCYAYNDYCYVDSSNHCVNIQAARTCGTLQTGSECSSCKSKHECTTIIDNVESDPCTWNGFIHTCRDWCPEPNLALNYTSGNVFNVHLNGARTAEYYYKTRVSLRYTNHTLTPNVPETLENVTTTVRVLEEGCNNVVVEWTLTNDGDDDVRVGVCLWGGSLLNLTYLFRLTDGHGIRNGLNTFFIQAEESFSGIYGGSIDNREEYCASTSSTGSEVYVGVSMNWNNVLVGTHTTRVFWITFATCEGCYAADCKRGNCSACSTEECYTHDSRCYVNSTGSCDRASEHRSCSTTETGYQCSSCLSQWECKTLMKDSGYTCFWSSSSHQCSHNPITCSEGNCSACPSDDNCYTTSNCYLSSVSGCKNSEIIPTCDAVFTRNCSSCKSENECTIAMGDSFYFCSWDSVNHTCSEFCPEPRVGLGEISGCSFDILLNNTSTSDGYHSVVRINYTESFSDLTPGVPLTISGVTTTMRLWEESCNVVGVEWKVINNRADEARVGICLYGDTRFTGEYVNGWSNLQGVRGIRARNYPLFIQAEEGFTGTYIGSSFMATSHCSIFGGFIQSNYDAGVGVNWNNVTVGAGEMHVFRMAFAACMDCYATSPSPIPTPVDCAEGNCSACDSPSECWSANIYCFWDSTFNCRNSDTNPTCYTSIADCNICQSEGECGRVTTNGLSCSWDNTTHTCRNTPCSDGNCAACTTEDCHVYNEACYYLGGGCYNAWDIPSCHEDSECSWCQTRTECTSVQRYSCEWDSVIHTCGIGCSDLSAPCGACSNSQSACYGKADYCYFDSDSSLCLDSSNSRSCGESSICAACLSAVDCLNTRSECTWNTLTYSCSPVSCIDSLLCSACGRSSNICFGKSIDCYHDGIDCLNYTITPTCSSSDGCQSCLSAAECADRSDCLWSSNNLSCAERIPLCTELTSECTSCNAKSICFGKGDECYYVDEICTNSTTTPTCLSTNACSQCLSAKDCLSTSTCFWNANDFSCNTNNPASLCADTTCASCTERDSCHALKLSCYWLTSSCVDSSLISTTTCSYSSSCSECLSAFDCTNYGISCEWDSNTYTCIDSTSHCGDYTCSSCFTEAACHRKDSTCFWSTRTYQQQQCLNSSSAATCGGADICSTCLSQFDCLTRGLECGWDADNRTCFPRQCSDASAGCSACSSSEAECFGKGEACYWSSLASACVDSSYAEDATCDSTTPCSLCSSRFDCLERGRLCRWKADEYTCLLIKCSDDTSNCSVCTTSEEECFTKDALCYFTSRNTCSNSSNDATCDASDPCTRCLSRFECSNRQFDCAWNMETNSCTTLPCAGDTPKCYLCSGSASDCFGKSDVCFFNSSSSTCSNSSDNAHTTCLSTDSCISCLSRYDCSERGFNCEWVSSNFSCLAKGNQNKAPIPGWAYFLMVGLPIIIVVASAAVGVTIFLVVKKKKDGAVNGNKSRNNEHSSQTQTHEDEMVSNSSKAQVQVQTQIQAQAHADQAETQAQIPPLQGLEAHREIPLQDFHANPLADQELAQAHTQAQEKAQNLPQITKEETVGESDSVPNIQAYSFVVDEGYTPGPNEERAPESEGYDIMVEEDS